MRISVWSSYVCSSDLVYYHHAVYPPVWRASVSSTMPIAQPQSFLHVHAFSFLALIFRQFALVSGWRHLALAALLIAWATTAWSDTVWLKNGDRLTGTIKSLDGGQLLMDTEYGGVLRDRKSTRMNSSH